MYEKDFARRLSIHWCDLDKHEIVEAVGPENIAGSGLVEEADLTAAVAHVRELEGQLDLVDARRSAAEKRASEAMRERDEARAEIVARSESVMRQAETITGLRAKLAEEEMVSESWRIRIAAAVGAVHEWDHGSAPGTWEQIEDKAESDRKQADATLDEMIVYRDKCETLESRLTRYAALESAAMKLCKSSTDAEWQALSAALDALSAPAPKPEQGETEPQSWPCRECVENKDGRCEIAGMPVENERDEEYCPNFTRRMPETLVAVATEVGNG